MRVIRERMGGRWERKAVEEGGMERREKERVERRVRRVVRVVRR